MLSLGNWLLICQRIVRLRSVSVRELRLLNSLTLTAAGVTIRTWRNADIPNDNSRWLTWLPLIFKWFKKLGHKNELQ